MGDGFFDIGFDILNHIIAAILSVLGADFGCDCETGRHGHPQEIHFSEVGTFAAEEVAHRGISFSLAVAESVDFFCHRLVDLFRLKLLTVLVKYLIYCYYVRLYGAYSEQSCKPTVRLAPSVLQSYENSTINAKPTYIFFIPVS